MKGITIGGPTHTSGIQTAQNDGLRSDVGGKATVPAQGVVSPHMLMPCALPQSKHHPFVISDELKAEAAKLSEGDQTASLAQMSQRLRLEGRLIDEHLRHAERIEDPAAGYVNFVDLAGELGLTDRLPKEIDAVNIDLKRNLDALLSSEEPEPMRVAKMATLLKDMLQAQTGLLASRAAHYQEVRRIAAPTFTEAERSELLLSELSFSAYATQAALAVPTMVSTAHDKSEAIAKVLRQTGNLVEAQAWEVTANQLKSIQDHILPHFTAAVEQAKLPGLVKELQDTSGNSKHKALAFIGQGLRQMGLSGLALGAVRAFTLAGLEQSPLGKLLAASLTTAVMHEIGTHFIAPLILEVIGGATCPVDTARVLPAPNRYVSVNGSVRLRTGEELAAATDEVERLRREHRFSKNANKVGSGTGESKAWSMFAAFQGVNGGVTSVMDLGLFQKAGAAVLGSMGGGFFMGGIHGADSLSSKTKDQYGRPIPAHTMQASSIEPLTKRVRDIGKSAAKNLNPFTEKNITTLANKTSGLATGMAAAKLGAPIISAVENNTPAVRAGVTALVSGLQSIVLLNQAWGAFSLSAQVAADRKALLRDRSKAANEEGGQPALPAPGAYDRTRTVLKNIYAPGRSDESHAFKEGTAGRVAENTSVISQGIGGLPGAFINDSMAALTAPIVNKIARALGSETTGEH
jgi:hypothetical protein